MADAPAIELSTRAASELADIARYTRRHFGARQADEYREGLMAVLELLAKHPLLGSDQGHIRDGLRRYAYRSHTIYYRPTREATLILRILGPGQDPLKVIQAPARGR